MYFLFREYYQDCVLKKGKILSFYLFMFTNKHIKLMTNHG